MKHVHILTSCLIMAVLLFGCAAEKELVQKKSPEKKEITNKEYRQFQEYFFDANRAKILGNYDQAKTLFSRAMEINPGDGASRYEMAKILVEEGSLQAALPYLKEARQLEPNNPWYGEFLAQLYAEVGRLEESIEVVRTIIENHPEKYEYYFNLASLLAAQGKYSEALDIYNDLESRFGLMEEIALQRQMLYIEQNAFEKALMEADKLIQSNPEEVRYYGIKAEVLEKIGREADAISLYKEMLEIDPDNGLVLLALYELSEKQGKKSEAKDYLSNAFISQDLGIDVKVNILLNLLSAPSFQQNSDFVVSLSEKLVKAHPDDAKAHAIQGDIYFNLGELEKSREQFRKAVKIDANRPPIWQQILTIDSQLNDFDALLRESDEALELFPQQPVFYLFRGIALLQSEKPSEAVDVLNSGKNLVIENNSALAQFYASLGDAYHELKRHQESDDSYQKALQYEPGNVVVLNNYAYYLSLRDQNLDKAETMAKKANDLSPNTASFQDTYAWVLYKKGNYQNALFWIQEAIKNGGSNDPVVLEHHGDILAALKKRDDAIAAWKLALKAGGDTETLNEKIDQFSGEENE